MLLCFIRFSNEIGLISHFCLTFSYVELSFFFHLAFLSLRLSLLTFFLGQRTKHTRCAVVEINIQISSEEVRFFFPSMAIHTEHSCDVVCIATLRDRSGIV